jgi:hypothetical protein
MKPSNIGDLALEFAKHKDVDLGKPRKAAPLPNGNYTVRVEKCMWDTAKTGTPYINWHFRIVDGDHEGRMLFKEHYLKPGSEVNFRILAEDLKLILGEVPPLDSPTLLDSLLDKVLFVRKRDRDNGYDIYINGVDKRVEDENPPASTHIADDDIPF